MKKLTLFALVSVFLTSYIGTRAYISRLPAERYTTVVSKVLPTTVTIYVRVSRIDPKTKKKEFGTISGSGVFISPTGHILTCAHLFWVGQAESLSVETVNGWVLPAELLYKEDGRDLSLLKVEYIPSPYARIVKPGGYQVGQEVIAIGSPLGLNSTVTTGVISAIGRDVIRYDQIQMSAPINPGNSGGPLFNLTGEVVGINTNIITTDILFATWSGLGFSVSASEINKFLWKFHGIEKALRR